MMTPEQIAALEKRARKGAARTGRPYEGILAELVAEAEGHRLGELFRNRELDEEWRERERRAPRRGRHATALMAALALAAGAPVLPTLDFTPRPPRRGPR